MNKIDNSWKNYYKYKAKQVFVVGILETILLKKCKKNTYF